LLVGIFSTAIVFEGTALKTSEIFLLFTVLCSGQALLALFPPKDEHFETTLFALFLTDSLLAMILVRNSGSSSSPFLVLFPLLALAGSVVFRARFSYLLTSLLGLFMVVAVGFGMAIVGNGLAIVTTGVLGVYLMKALTASGVALKKSEGARRRLENLQKAILANIPSGLMSVDSEGHVIQVNGVGLKILGIKESDVLNVHLRDVLPEIADKVYRSKTIVPLTGLESNTERHTLAHQRPDGEALSLGYSVARLKDPEDNSVLGTLVVFQDLTLITRMEENLRMSEKLAAVGKLAAGIAHEIRNPLAGISGSAQLLSGHADLIDEDRKLLDIIQRESTRLDGLITEFLEYVRPQKPKLEPVKIEVLIGQVLESVRVNPKWKDSNATVTVRSEAPAEFTLQGDRNKIIQVLMNLLLNSVQAGAKRIEVVLTVSGIVEVRDDGKGISKEHLGRLFEPFFTTKESGTGLGLAVSYRSLEAMGAVVNVRSPIPEFTPQGGTAFQMQFRVRN